MDVIKVVFPSVAVKAEAGFLIQLAIGERRLNALFTEEQSPIGGCDGLLSANIRYVALNNCFPTRAALSC